MFTTKLSCFPKLNRSISAYLFCFSARNGRSKVILATLPRGNSALTQPGSHSWHLPFRLLGDQPRTHWAEYINGAPFVLVARVHFPYMRISKPGSEDEVESSGEDEVESLVALLLHAQMMKLGNLNVPKVDEGFASILSERIAQNSLQERRFFVAGRNRFNEDLIIKVRLFPAAILVARTHLLARADFELDGWAGGRTYLRGNLNVPKVDEVFASILPWRITQNSLQRRRPFIDFAIRDELRDEKRFLIGASFCLKNLGANCCINCTHDVIIFFERDKYAVPVESTKSGTP
ncbi:uncharacterized protein LACBIDRAFT_328008 [Laccaria bicolor S238N-H82]|uniref:Predicted protein n=1 Tax=Laccaria bicolor (strain S238N-H82 / ATCC MYA-4686) TaxID=486041 RepID=B0DDJ2_LACBS|nr:uncharacterized protein LACBIDRAFT_328008 [Laccaria bicolor S238N-H82]EDR07483.1 predicted protein [Laccaria bicolor S238N-H82]|eukprot:XP_001881875.1 predicted protein [Laccaria bicolor S238N-H82]